MMLCHVNSEEGYSQTQSFIQNYIKPEYLQVPVIRRALEDVEGVYKIEGLAMYSKEHGVKSPGSLSNGMRTLILLYCYKEHGFLLNSSNMGPNVTKYLGELSTICDFEINLNYFCKIPDDYVVNAKDIETGTLYTNGKDFTRAYARKAGI